MNDNSEREYQEKKKFLSSFSELFLQIEGLPPEHGPIAALETLEKRNKKQAISGLQQAINDCIEMSRHIKLDEVERIDAELRKRKIITLSELRRQYSKDYAKTLKRKKIKNEVEYYLVRGMLNDISAKINDTERKLLGSLLSNYEGRVLGK